MNQDIVEYAINYAQSNNTDYVEARLQRNRHKIAILRNGNPEPSVDVDIMGIGIRVLVNGAYSFAATNSLNTRVFLEKSMLNATDWPDG